MFLIQADILDIVPTDSGFIYLARETIGKEVKGIFHRYDQIDEKFYSSDITEYIYAKFGNDGKNIASQLGDFVNCKITTLFDGSLLAGYPDGSFKIIRDGRLTDVDELMYQGCPASSPAAFGRDTWFVVPEANAVINYSIEHGRVELRIGGPNTKSFCRPVDLRIYNNKLYICNEYSYKIRCISLGTYNVEDYRVFNEEIRYYFRSGEKEYVVLKSGVYEM